MAELLPVLVSLALVHGRPFARHVRRPAPVVPVRPEAKLRRRLPNLLLTVVAAALGLTALLVVAGPVTGRFRTVTVLSGSMRPTLEAGDIAVTVPVPADEVAVGDVLTFHPPGSSSTVTHRVVALRHENGRVHVKTKGDANDAVDAYDVVLRGDTAWRTVAGVPGAGYLLAAVRSVLASSLFLPVVGALLALSLLVTIWSEPSEGRRA